MTGENTPTRQARPEGRACYSLAMAFRKKTTAVKPAEGDTVEDARRSQPGSLDTSSRLDGNDSAPGAQPDPIYPDLTSPHARGIARKSEALKWL